MITDPAQIEKSLHFLVNLYWVDEMQDFEKMYNTHISSQETLDDVINWCEAVSAFPGEHHTSKPVSHPFYHLMIIKSAYML